MVESSARQGNPPVETQTSFVYQGWSPKISQAFHYAPQGSELVPYYWFLHLAEPNGVLLKDDLLSCGVVYDEATTDNAILNPDHLPIGFARQEEKHTFPDGIPEEHWLGLTCAACHTGAIIPKQDSNAGPQRMYLIDGAPATMNFGAILVKLQSSIQWTYDHPDRLTSFAKDVANEGNDGSAGDVENKFKKWAPIMQKMLGLYIPQRLGGPGRLDCIGAILNRVCVYDIHSKQNPPALLNAPVKFPFLWYTDRQSKIQWFGGVSNDSWIARLGRNSGEVTGVFAQYDERFGIVNRSSVNVSGLAKIDDWVSSLKPPRWNDVFPAYDTVAAGKGHDLFVSTCQANGCHQDVAPFGKVWAVQPTPLLQDPDDNPLKLPNLNTDRNNTMLANAATSNTNLLTLGSGKPVAAIDVLDRLVLGALLNDGGDVLAAYRRYKYKQLYNLSDPSLATPQQKNHVDQIAKTANLFGSKQKKTPGDFDPLVDGYESRSLNGIWAAAPYLHNGSVPNLYELLGLIDREPTFYVGSHVYDPSVLGYVSDSVNGTKFDTSSPGNSNKGHTYGWALHDWEKKEIIEYLKSLQ